jgi:hypothetical protein
VFTGTAGNEAFRATPTWSRMTGTGFPKRQANGFEIVEAYGNGGNDTAELVGMANSDDVVKAWPTKATLTGVGYTQVVEGFNTIAAYGGAGGNDVAQLNDSAGDDTFTGSPQTATMRDSNKTYLLSASQFELIQGISSGKGTDMAVLADSKGNDVFWADSTLARMYGTGYNLRVRNFDNMYGTASGGHDVAKLYGTAAAETVRAETNMVRVFGKTFFHRARYFDEYFIDGKEGKDTATVFDGTVPAGYTMPAGAKSTDFAQCARLYNIETVQVRKLADASVKKDITKIDDVFAYWS